MNSPPPARLRAAAALVSLSCLMLLDACGQIPAQRPVPRQAQPQAPAAAYQREIAPSAPLEAEARIALLLPQHGPYARLAETVRDGFLAALYAQAAPRPSVRIYDSGDSIDSLRQAVRQAINDGARFLVGPLQKDLVATMAAQGVPPVPVLALNYLEAQQNAPGNFYQLGVAPEDEARAAAEQAAAAGLRRAAALTPQGEWGERALSAFSRRLTELGGTVVSAQRYGSDADSLSAAVRLMMGLPESEERRRALAATLGAKLEFDARRRDDLDFVFVAAHPALGRLIVPQLRFYRLGSLPVYATAQVFDNGTGDADLSGLYACDMPMLLDTEGRYAMLRAQSADLLGLRAREQFRLLALGYDAFQLIGFLRLGPLPAGGGFPAATGDLGMGGNGAVARGLSCAALTRVPPIPRLTP